MRVPDFLRGIYAITPDGLETRELLTAVRAVLCGGVRLVQHRSKTADADHRRREAGQLLALCRAYGARLIINDDPLLARALGADGVHLGRDDPAPAFVRGDWPSAIIGVSCYDQLALAERAEHEGDADYVAFGAFFPSTTKPDAVRAPLDLLTLARRRVRLPICAIGGIQRDNAAALIAAGADLLAVSADLFWPLDHRIEARARAWVQLVS
jgi:thiamine-phosphate pyrophosphorylase